MFKYITATTALALIAGAVSAEPQNYARVSLDRIDLRADEDTLNESARLLLQGAFEYGISDFFVTGDLDFGLGFEAVDVDLDLDVRSRAALSFGYALSPQIAFGLGITEDNYTIGPVEYATAVELFAQYRADNFDAALNLQQRRYEDDDDVFLRDVTAATLYGRFAPSSTLTFAAKLAGETEADETLYHISATYADGPTSLRGYYASTSETDVTQAGARGYYEIGDRFRALGSVAVLQSEALDAQAVSFGGGFALGQSVWADASVGGVFYENDALNDQALLQLTLTFETGQRRRLDRQMDQNILDDFQGGLLARRRF